MDRDVALGWPRELMPSTDMMFEIAQDNMPGMALMRKFGANMDVDVGAEDIWDGGGTWVAPTQARTHDIVSTDVNDDGSPVGTGARTIEIQGLDGNYDLQGETITMNGTTNVPTVNQYIMIHRMKVLTAGSTGNNVGDITATAQTDGTVTAQISASRNQTLMAIYQIPNGKTGYLLRWYVDAFRATISGGVDAWFSIKPLGGVFQQKSHRSLQGQGGSSTTAKVLFLPAMAKSIIKVCANPTAVNYKIAAGFDLILVDD